MCKAYCSAVRIYSLAMTSRQEDTSIIHMNQSKAKQKVKKGVKTQASFSRKARKCITRSKDPTIIQVRQRIFSNWTLQFAPIQPSVQRKNVAAKKLRLYTAKTGFRRYALLSFSDWPYNRSSLTSTIWVTVLNYSFSIVR